MTLGGEFLRLPIMSCHQRRPGVSVIAATSLPTSDMTDCPHRHAAFEVADLSGTVFAQLAAVSLNGPLSRRT
jgi:hypothetical protein